MIKNLPRAAGEERRESASGLSNIQAAGGTTKYICPSDLLPFPFDGCCLLPPSVLIRYRPRARMLEHASSSSSSSSSLWSLRQKKCALCCRRRRHLRHCHDSLKGRSSSLSLSLSFFAATVCFLAHSFQHFAVK